MTSVPRWLPVALLVCFLVHNSEEALTYGRYRERSAALLNRLMGVPGVPSEAAFHLALMLVSLLAAVAMVVVIARPAAPLARSVTIALAAVMLVNVAVPHVPAALLLGGYAPGVVTAVLLNLPVALLALRRLALDRRRGRS